MLSCAGNKYLKTPSMDAIAARGVRFERAYCANPVCLPSRFAMLTGRLPSCVGIRENGDGRRGVPPSFVENGIGHVFRQAGYATAYGGKVHLPRGMTPQSLGFEMITGNSRDELAQAGSQFVRREHDRPFLLVLSFINPHDICYLAIRDHDPNSQLGRRVPPPLDEALKRPEGVSEETFFARVCPPLPENFEPQSDEPEVIRTGLFQRAFKRHAREQWSEQQWRLHRWAYCRLTEKVDGQVGVVLQALQESGLDQNTVIVFTSDHGDMDSSHRLEHKSMLYEEAARVPFLVSDPNCPSPGGADRQHLVSAGLDLLPTLCDYAGIDTPAGLTGRSVRALVQGRGAAPWRTTLASESQFGRMLLSAQFKYVLYDRGKNREQLYDLGKDPGEMKNFAADPAYAAVLREHRRHLAEHVDRTGDSMAREYLVRP
jgi:choline-sulfatase